MSDPGYAGTTVDTGTTGPPRGTSGNGGGAFPTDQIRVFQFITNLFIGGTERQLVNLAKRLDPSRFELRFGCFVRGGELLGEITQRGIPVAEYRIPRLYGARAWREGLRLARDLRRARTDIVHTYTFHGNLFAVPAARLAGVPAVVASIRDYGAHLTPLEHRAQQIVCRLAHRIAVNSEALRQRLVAQGYDPAKIVVIRNGVDLSTFRPRGGNGRLRRELGLPSGAPIVAVFSRLIPLKGIDYFLEAAALVTRRVPEARFLVVGDHYVKGRGRAIVRDDAYRMELDRAVARLGLNGRVVFTGFRLDVPDLLTETAVSVLPSVSGEGLPNAVLEAMAAGVPVVATDVEGSAEAVEDGATGLLVRPRDAHALAGAVCRFLEAPALAARFRAAGRERMERYFSIERCVRETEALYLDLLVPASRRAARGAR